MNGRGYSEMTSAERLAQQHAMETAMDWQYAIVWRQARDTDPHPVLGPPEIDGNNRWEINTDCGEQGQVVTVPSWSEGSIVFQSTRWRRVYRGMTNAHPRRVVHVRVAWDGDPKP